MSDSASSALKPRVRFAPSPTGFLHVGSARTFIFNWLYARHNGGTMIFRLDDTDVERNTDASVQSIFEGLRWLGLDWDEEYKQSARLDLHRAAAWQIFDKGLAYRDFTPAHAAEGEASSAQGAWLFNPGMREMSREESDRRAAAGEPFALRYRVPRNQDRIVAFNDAVYGEMSKPADEIEDFALLRSDGNPTYHLGSCVDDADLRITQIIRGQDHLTNTFKHVLIFEGLGAQPPQFAHLPLLVAPDGAKLSKRKHGPVVSVTTYRDAGFLPEAFINFLCLLGWSPKNDLEFMPIAELTRLFTLEGVNRSNAVVNFSEESPFDPKAIHLNGEHLRALSLDDLAQRLQPFFIQAGLIAGTNTTEGAPSISAPSAEMGGMDAGADQATKAGAPSISAPSAEMGGTNQKLLEVTPLIRERIKLLGEAPAAADFFFVENLPEYDPNELIPPKGADAATTLKILDHAAELLATLPDWNHGSLEHALRNAAAELSLKPGPMFQPIRVAVCGRKNAPPLFETMTVLGRETCLTRIRQGREKLQPLAS